MKGLALFALSSALVLGLLGKFFTLNEELAAKDYQNIMDYVTSVERAGFNKADFDRFAYDRKRMVKNVLVANAIDSRCQMGASVLLAVGLGLVAFGWRRRSGVVSN